jgi:hypothetical protein
VTPDGSLGRFLEADPEGWLVNPAGAAPLQPAWAPALEALTHACRQRAGETYDSFYVRGSVAAGAAIAGSSDLDTVLLLGDSLGERRPEWAHALAAALLEEHPFLLDVEVVVLGRGALLEARRHPEGADPVMAQWCFLLALGGRCLDGPDVLGDLGRYRGGPEVAFVLRGLPRTMREFERRWAANGVAPPGPEAEASRRKLVAWTCKKLLRAGAELAMLRDGRFTRDLAPCARRLGERLPRFAGVADRLLRWAIAPGAEATGLDAVVTELEPVLLEEACAEGLVPEPRPT